MQYELFKTDKVAVDIDFKKIYSTVVKELEVKENDYDEHDDYAFVICDYFGMNMCSIMEELFGINFSNAYDSNYYDAEVNGHELENICEDFEDYVYNKEYKTL